MISFLSPLAAVVKSTGTFPLRVLHPMSGGGKDKATILLYGASQAALVERTCLPKQEMRVQSLSQADPLEEGMATDSSVLAWRIPGTEKPGGIQSMGSQGAGHN